MRSARKTKSKYRAKDRLLTHKGHGDDVTDALSTVVENAAYADVKIVCSGAVGGVFWSHRIILAAVSPFLKTLLLGSEDDGSVLTLHLPQVAAAHVRLVLDYVYTGAMYLRADQLAGVVRLFEVLRMKCGVSVSKMVAVEERTKGGGRTRKRSSTPKTTKWVEEAEFQGFEELKTDIKAEENNVDEEFSVPAWHNVEGASVTTTKKPATTEKPEDSAEELPVAPHETTAASIIETSLATVEEEEEEDEEPPVEVRPVALSDYQRKMSREYSVVEVDEESDSEEEADFSATAEVSDGKDGDADLSAAGKLPLAGNSNNESDSFRCIMCEKVFRHADNLKVHLQSHLGTRAKLKSCGLCRRNFRSSLEHELHVNAHRYARHPLMRKHATPKRPLENGLRRRLVKRALRAAMARQAEATAAAVAALKKDRAAEKREARIMKGKRPSPQQKKRRGRPKKQPETPVKKKVQKVRHERSLARDPFKLKMKVKLEPVALREYEKKRRRSESKNRDRAPVEKRKKKKIVIPKRRKRRRSSSDEDEEEDEEYAPAPAYVRHATAAPSAPKKVRQTAEEKLTCPTCDKVFVARSILERHLKTSGHGGGDRAGDLQPQAPGPGFVVGPNVPHLNAVLQPKMDVGGFEVNKYECHLCNAVFVRVKDLAKHRERQCTAWSSVA